MVLVTIIATSLTGSVGTGADKRQKRLASHRKNSINTGKDKDKDKDKGKSGLISDNPVVTV